MSLFNKRGTPLFNVESPRYHATFQHGNMEHEKEGDDLALIKRWLTGWLGDFPNPTHAMIRDTVEDKTLFEEHNPQ